MAFSSPYGRYALLCFVSSGDTRGYWVAFDVDFEVVAADVTPPAVGACFPERFSSSVPESPKVTFFYFPAEVACWSL